MLWQTFIRDFFHLIPVLASYLLYTWVATGQGKVWEIQGQGNPEKSGSFEKSLGNLEFSKKSGKFAIGQGNLNIIDGYFTHANGNNFPVCQENLLW